MDSQNLTFVLAAVFGLVSFFSPCVLPLVPVYIGYLTGATVAGADEEGRVGRWYTFSHAAALVLGFTLVFVALGALGGVLGAILGGALGRLGDVLGGTLGENVGGPATDTLFKAIGSWIGSLGGQTTGIMIGRDVATAFSRAIPAINRVGGVMLAVFGLRIAHIRWSIGRWIVTALIVALFAYAVNIRETMPNRVLMATMFGVITLAGFAWPVAGHIALGVLAGLLNFLAIWEGTAALTGIRALGGFTSTFAAVGESALIVLLIAWASRTDLFYMEHRMDVGRDRSLGYSTSFLTGIVFAAGWTPCIGPILAGILVMAATAQSAIRGGALLLFYSIGLAIPFLLAGLLFNQLGGYLPRINKYLPIISVVSGFLMVAVGVVIYTGGLQLMSTLVPQVELESWLLGILGGGR